MRFSRLIFVACLLLAGSASAAMDPAALQHLHWRLVGPFRGGRVLAVAGVPGDARHFYFGAVNGGVWETNDAGRTWQPKFDAQPIGSIGAIAVAPSAPQTLYVGSGEADMRSDIAQGDGVYKSTDGGRSWANVGLRDSQQIARVLVHPDNADLVYVAALGHPYGPNAERGVFRSRDGGKSWQKILGPDSATGAADLAFEPGNPRVLYAALWQTRRPPWSIYAPSNGPGSGVYKSTDGGDSWQRIEGHGFAAHVGRVGFALSAAAPRRVYAIVDGDEGGLYASDDAGASWTRKSADQRIWARCWYFCSITADPRNAERVYAMNTIVLRSDDGGATFLPLKGDPTGDDFHALWIDPNAPERQILGSDQGAQVTLNGGVTWSSWHNQPTAQIYHVSTDRRTPYWIYGAQQDSGALSLPSRGDGNDGINMTQFHELTVGGESDNIAPDPDDPQTVFGGRVDKLDLKSEQTRHVDPTFAEPDLYRRTWTLPLAFSARQPHVLYFANQKLFRTADRGEHWDAISPDLTRPDPGAPATLDASAAANNLGNGPRRGVIYAIAPSRTADKDLWLGTDDGLIWRTRDEGAHWDNVTPKALAPWSKVGTIDASPFDADSAYVAIDRHRLDDFKPYILRTHDGGKSWQATAGGIADGSFVNVVRADPVRRGLLYAGTEKGVYVSFDDGAQWQPLQNGLPVTSVRDLEVHDADLVIATHGRGFWVLDDISALRQLDRDDTRTVQLYAPHDALRIRTPEFTGTLLPQDEPRAPNAPAGAYIDYVLPAAPQAPLLLEILDAQGALVRKYSSAEHAPAPDLAKMENAPEWTNVPVPPAATAGAHRFVWSLRYPAPAALADGNPFADGVWAAPGKYTVALTVDGQRLTQTLTIRPDPRMQLEQAAYAQQFALAREIEAQRAQLAPAVAAAGSMLQQLKARRADTPALAHEIDALSTRVYALAGTHPAANPKNGWAFPPLSTHTLRFLADSLEQLQKAVDDADAAPSPDVQHGFLKLKPMLADTLRDWHALQGNEIAALNVKLKAAQREVLGEAK